MEPSLHPTEGHLGEDFGPDDLLPCADSADGPSSLDNGPEDPSQPSRWSFLGRGKTVQSLVAAIAKEKTDAELHAFTVGELLKEVFHRGGGKVTMAELEEARDDFISASMAIVPRELSRRLVSAVANPAKEQGNKKKQESDPKKLGGPPLQGDPVDIDCTTVQKTYLLTVSGLNAASVPEHQEILNLALQSFVEVGYPASVYPTHMAVFREPHQDGGMHFHIATAFSEPFRWIGWKCEKSAVHRSEVRSNASTKFLQNYAGRRVRQPRTPNTSAERKFTNLIKLKQCRVKKTVSPSTPTC